MWLKERDHLNILVKEMQTQTKLSDFKSQKSCCMTGYLGKYTELAGQTQFSKIWPCPVCLGNCQGSVAAGDGREAYIPCSVSIRCPFESNMTPENIVDRSM